MKESGLGKIEKVETLYKKFLESMEATGFKLSYTDGGNYYIDQVILYAKALFDNHPFKVGDNIWLVDPPNIPNSDHGWWFYRKIFVKGESFIVVDRDYSGKDFIIHVKHQLYPDALFCIKASRFQHLDEL
jgi:hypothetical protein